MGMEGRLGSKIDTTNQKVDKALSLVAETNTALEDLEIRMEATEAAIDAKLENAEDRLRVEVQQQVKGMVVDQLKAAGFDPDLTAAGLSTIRSESLSHPSYAEATMAPVLQVGPSLPRTKEERQEENFWTCRRSLRLWPVEDTSREALDTFLVDILRLERAFVKDDLGKITIKRQIQRKGGNKKEVCVTFESKEARDAVQGRAPSLANHRGDAGMLLHIPDHLQKTFRALMAVAFDLKKKFPALKRNIKFDEDTLSLFMDVQLKQDEDWKRIFPEQAMKAAANRPRNNGPRSIEENELAGLLSQE